MDLNKPLIPEFQDYTDQYGMIQLDGKSTSDNGILFTAFYILGLAKKGLMTDDERARLIQVLSNNFIQPGLMVRYPGSKDFEAHDDHMGLLMADALLRPSTTPLVQDVLVYGQGAICDKVDPREPLPEVQKQNKILFAILKLFGGPKFNYNPVVPNTFSINSWLGRRLELVASIKMAAKAKVGVIEYIYWCIAMLKNIILSDKTDNVGYSLLMCSAIACEGYGPFTRFICNRFRHKIKRLYGDFGQVFAEGHTNVPNHPLIAFLKGVY